MTAVVIAPRREDPLSDTEAVLSEASFRVRPSVDYVAGGEWVLAVWSDPVDLVGSAVTIQLDPLPAVPYELEITIPDRDSPNSKLIVREYRIVPSSGTPVTWESCQKVPGPGSTPEIPSALEARVTALEAAIASFSGGASNLAGITDMSPLARTLNAATTTSAMRTILAAAAATHTHNISDLNTTGTPTSSTYLSGTAAWSAPTGAGISNYSEIASLTGYPASFPPDTHTHPVTDLNDSTAAGRSLLTAADVTALRTLLNVYSKAEQITDANLPANTVMFGDGSTSARPTARTDIRVYWTASALPTNVIANDVWDNVPD